MRKKGTLSLWNTNKLKLKIPTEKCLELLDHVEETGDTSKFFEHIDLSKDAVQCVDLMLRCLEIKLHV